MNKLRLLTIGILILSVIISGCGTSSINFPIGNKEPKIQTVVSEQLSIPIYKYKTLNPIISHDETTYNLNNLLYDSLIIVSETDEVLPSLAKDWQYENNNKDLVFNLRSDVLFSDGSKLIAEDVVFTIRSIINANQDSTIYKNAVENIRTVYALNDSQVKISFYSSAYNISEFTFPIIRDGLFPTYYSLYSSIEDYEPVGTGPYIIDYVESNEYIALKRNKTYFKDYSIENDIKLVIIPKTANQFKLLEIDEINLMYADSYDWEKYLGDDTIIIHEYMTNQVDFIGFNFYKEAMKNKSLRKGVAYSIDKQYIGKTHFLGHVEYSDNLYSPSYLGNNASEMFYNANELTALSYFAEAGYKQDQNDVLINELTEQPLAIEILVNMDNEEHVNISNEIKKDLDNIGIQTIINSVSYDEYQLKVQSHQFDIVVGGYNVSPAMDVKKVYMSYGNILGYVNQELDGLLLEMQSAKTTADQIIIFNQIKNIAKEELPYYPLFYRKKAIITKTGLKGNIDPSYNNIFKGIEDWKYEKEIIVSE